VNNKFYLYVKFFCRKYMASHELIQEKKNIKISISINQKREKNSYKLKIFTLYMRDNMYILNNLYTKV